MWFTATVLRDGRVLVAGGFTGSMIQVNCELYDPRTGNVASTGSLNIARAGHTATLLQDGRVLLAGGIDDTATVRDSVEIYDPATGEWTIAEHMSTARQYQTATLLPDGRVLIAGGHNNGGYLSSSELYEPATGHWTSTSDLNGPRASTRRPSSPTAGSWSPAARAPIRWTASCCSTVGRVFSPPGGRG
jgi:hypothetical protein